MGNSKNRSLRAVALVAVAAALAFLGRFALDWLIELAPSRSGMIERFGGWVLGMFIGIIVILPISRIYGLLNGKELRESSAATSKQAKDNDASNRT